LFKKFSPSERWAFLFAKFFFKKEYNVYMKTYESYQALVKPSFAPPSYLFGPVWTFLYVLIFISFSKVFMGVYDKNIPFIVALPFVLNLIFNFAYTPLMFGLKNNTLASIDILLVLGTIIWMMIAIFPYMRSVTYMQIPYLIWVSFATVLQLSIYFLNK
jgi:tryptophan-rich sensory protein